MLRRWTSSGSEWWRRLAPNCGYSRCSLAESKLRRIYRRPHSVILQGARYCHTECLEQALAEILRERPVVQRSPMAHRIPLGLLLLSRQQLTQEQLRVALHAQREAARETGERGSEGAQEFENYGTKKIGVWLQELGFASEPQVTAALARQWSCPVLQTELMPLDSVRFPAIPARLLEWFQMMPVEAVEATKTLLMAFSERIDYAVLFAIQQMLGYRAEACLVRPSILEEKLQAFLRLHSTGNLVFDRLQDTREAARIIASYATNAKADEVRVARCGEHWWVRLERGRRAAITLVLKTKSQFPAVAS
jgi:hypothetical protein